MTDKWEVITDTERLFHLKKQGWEIEVHSNGGWIEWYGTGWQAMWEFRARPAKPKTRTVKYECFDVDGELVWRNESLSILGDWKRRPSLDKTVEVSDDN